MEDEKAVDFLWAVSVEKYGWKWLKTWGLRANLDQSLQELNGIRENNKLRVREPMA